MLKLVVASWRKITETFSIGFLQNDESIVENDWILAIGLRLRNNNQTVEAEIHIIAINSDLFFYSKWKQSHFEELKNKKSVIRNCFSIHGHDAFLIEYKQLHNLLQDIF
jgi:hypothetical protein